MYDPTPAAMTSIARSLPPDGMSAWAHLEHARRSDPVGHRVHTAMAAFYFMLLPLATAPKDVAFGVLAGYWLLRLRHTWHSHRALRRDPLIWLLAAWAGWQALAISWSDHLAEGFDEFKTMRTLLLPLLVWPVMEHIGLLIAALVAGVVLSNLVEMAQLLAWLPMDTTSDGRASAWLHPIQAGAMCVAGLCWTLAAALHARGGARWLALAAFVLALGGLAATESRGPWVAATVCVPAALLVIMIRRPATRRTGLLVAATAALACGVVWMLARDRIETRLTQAWHEFREAGEHQRYDTSAGLRFGTWSWSLDMFQAHPLIGIGVGAYRDAQLEHPAVIEALARSPEQRKYLTRDHPHSMYLYTLACSGSVGGAILLAVLTLLVIRCVRNRPDHLFADGTLFVLMSWMIGTMSDCYNLNGNLMGLFGLICIDALRDRPPATRLNWLRDPRLDRLSRT
jgi:O-antigen ligase